MNGKRKAENRVSTNTITQYQQMRPNIILFALAIIVLATSCKHRTKTADATQHDTTKQDTTVLVDIMPTAPDTDTLVSQVTHHRSLIFNEEDSAEVTNLRLFTRKQKEIYPPALLVGEWIRGTEHEVYHNDGTGRMWDSSDDVDASEAQRFNWTLDSNLLTIICHLELGGILPKRYVVTYADNENLAYQDLYGKAYLWDKKN